MNGGANEMDPKARYAKERTISRQNRTAVILETAERVFTLKGIDKTTMQDIAMEANIGIATLFRYFPKKEKLIVAVATKLLEPTLQRFTEIADLPLSCLDKLSHLFDYFIEDHHNPSTKLMSDFENYAAHTSDPLEGMDEFKALHQRIADQFSTIIQAGMEDGSIRSDLSIEETLLTVINAFGLFSKKLSLKASFLLLDSDLESSRQLAILKNMMIDYLKA
ncbi:TetR/AcrR family transcriptional regulator [Paenibacillus sp. SN-8-1]|uniref:TetR/AcrR family transcriptional regulator n=1 Tax=Paenibacillus sp. SN-8-1 TaxID=3435409 RepID=UPI003D9A3699